MSVSNFFFFYLDPTIKNVDNENVLHFAVQSDNDDEEIVQIAELLFQNNR